MLVARKHSQTLIGRCFLSLSWWYIKQWCNLTVEKHLRFYAIKTEAVRDLARVPAEKGDEI